MSANFVANRSRKESERNECVSECRQPAVIAEFENAKLKSSDNYSKALEENKKLLKDILKMVKSNHHDI